jgi:hypothetical protein
MEEDEEQLIHMDQDIDPFFLFYFNFLFLTNILLKNSFLKKLINFNETFSNLFHLS